MVSDILRLPLRAAVASSSATRSSRSAQQSPPRSAALADGIVMPPMNRPAAATSATRLTTLTRVPRSFVLLRWTNANLPFHHGRGVLGYVVRQRPRPSVTVGLTQTLANGKQAKHELHSFPSRMLLKSRKSNRVGGALWPKCRSLRVSSMIRSVQGIILRQVARLFGKCL